MAKGDKGSATWEGSLKEGLGTMSTESGALSGQPYGFNTRFESKPGTNPEELIGAAFAGCFIMAMSKELEAEGLSDPEMDATATVHLNQVDEGFRITKVELDVTASVEGEDAAFDRAVEATKAGCPVANLLDTEIVYSVTRG